MKYKTLYPRPNNQDYSMTVTPNADMAMTLDQNLVSMTVNPNADNNNYADMVIQEINLPEETAQGTADDLHDTLTINIQQLRSVFGPDNGMIGQ